MKTAVHITHETIKKVGGIGAVLSGLCSADSYRGFFGRTVFYGPLFGESSKLFKDIGKDGDILFSSADSHDSGDYSSRLRGVRNKYGINIVYLKKSVSGDFNPDRKNTVDVVLADAGRMREPGIDSFKFELWEKYGLQSELYENDADFEQYLRIAVPYLEILEKLFGPGEEYFHFAHEYMGVFSALSVLMRGRKDKTLFVAHEVSTARSIAEELNGHDISFYNIMRKAGPGQHLEEIFGSRKHNPRNEIIKRAAHFDRIFAVSDLVKEEYEFLVPHISPEKIRVVYNGLSTKDATLEEYRQSRGALDAYINKLLNYTPDAFLTHVTRLVDSKGIWRDITLLYLLDEILHKRGMKGVYLLLSTAGGERPPEDILRMEKEYGWPAAHRPGWPDLVGREKEVYEHLQLFNARAKALRGVFLNQFGFGRALCGSRVPGELDFTGLRAGADCELGFSVYEPFGIAQLETIPFGGAAALSSSCGCAYMLEKLFKDASARPYRVVDFIGQGRESLEYDSLRELPSGERDRVELAALSNAAEEIFSVLPLSEEKRKEYIDNFNAYSGATDWEGIVRDYFLPNLPGRGD